MTRRIEVELPPHVQRKEYQCEALDAVVGEWEGGQRSTLLCMPTGTGKTITSGLIAKYVVEQLGHKVLFLAHRTELIQQALNTYSNAFAFSVAVEMGGLSERRFIQQHGREPEVVVGSIQSFHPERLASHYRPNSFGTIVIDEAHHSHADSYREILDYFRDYLLLGLTATPDGSKRGLGSIYESIAYQLRLRKAVEEGYLVPPVIRSVPVPINLREIRTTGGDFNAGDLAERINTAVEILCEQVHANIGERKTVIFTPDVGSAQAIASMLCQMGRKAEYVAGQGGKYGMPSHVRADKLERFKAGEFQVCVCCDLLVEGYDHPAISCVVVARPTRKRYKYVQMVGRGLRLYAGKINCLVLDLDWQQDDSSRDLCMPHSLFAEGDDERTRDALEILEGRIRQRKEAGEGGDDIAILAELREIEQDLHHARIIQVKYTGRHKELYACIDKTPFGIGRVLDIKMRKREDFDPWKCGPATPFQINRLKHLGVDGAEKLNLWGAGRLISKLESREKKGLASHQQVQELLSRGVSEQQARMCTRKEASAIIADIQQEMF